MLVDTVGIFSNFFGPNLNQYAIELVTYLLVLVVYFYESIVYMLLERNAFDPIANFERFLKFDKKKKKKYFYQPFFYQIFIDILIITFQVNRFIRT